MNVLSFVSDLWVVDLRACARIIACRSPWERNALGKSFSELLGDDELAWVSEQLFSYEMKPILTETAEGQLLVVLPSLMPSCAALVVLVPRLDRQMTLRFLVKRSGIGFAYGEKIAAEASGRMPGKVARYEKELALLTEEIRALDASGIAPRVLARSRRIDAFLRKRVATISKMTGCSAELGARCEIKDSECFDFGMFTHFLTVSFLLCRTAALDRCASVDLADDGNVTVRFLCDKEVLDAASWELQTIEGLAEERLMHFGLELCDGTLCLSLKPRRVDVSYLGLKAKDLLLRKK